MTEVRLALTLSIIHTSGKFSQFNLIFQLLLSNRVQGKHFTPPLYVLSNPIARFQLFAMYKLQCLCEEV